MPDRDSLQFAILGPLEITAGGAPIVLGGTQRKVLMAALLLEAGQVVPGHRLLEVIWGDPPPEKALATLRTHVSELRRRLETGSEVLLRKGTGYVLDVRPEQIDSEQARRLLEQGRRAVDDGDPVSAIAPLQEAQALWRGPPLVDLIDYPFTRAYVDALDELQLDIAKTRIAADLSLGRHREVIGDLRVLVTRHPHDDGLRRELVLAFYRDGRIEDAARACREGLEALHDLGLDSAMLQQLQEDVLRGASSLAWTPPRSLDRRVSVAPTSQGGYQLPPDIREYTGRDTIQAQVHAMLTDPVGLSRGTVVAAFAGKAGAGKTALAVHIAHRVRTGFTDTLYVDLRGNSTPLAPARVLSRFVQTLGVSRSAVPADPDDLGEMYRELLATRKVLIILDNAGGEAQIRPLLPTSPGCAVIITSRSRLHGLSAPYWMVDVLLPSDAVELLAKMVSTQRVDTEPEAARDIVGLCGYLPLAIQIAGRKLAAHPHWKLARLAGRLANERDRLSWLEAGDLEIRASFSLSYEGRPPDEQRAFRLLSLPAMSDFAPWAAAAVLDLDLDEAEDVVDRLADAQLLERRGADRTGTERYRFHDLLRVFARERETGVGTPLGHPAAPGRIPEAGGDNRHTGNGHTGNGHTGNGHHDAAGAPSAGAPSTEAPSTEAPSTVSGEHRAALGRLLYAYLAMLREAVDTFSPGGVRTLTPAAEDAAALTTGAVFRFEQAGVADLVGRPLVWFGGERGNLLSLIDQAHAAGLDEPTWLLATEAAEFYAFAAHWGDWEQSHVLGLAAARRGGHRLAEATLLTNLAERDITLAFEDAFWRLDADGTDPDGQPAVEVYRATVDHLALATERLTRARKIFVDFGDELGEARTLRGLADACRGRGEFSAALVHFEAGLEMMRRGGARKAEAETLVNVAMVHGDRDELTDGINCLTMSLSIARELGNRPLEALALRRLGDLHRFQYRLDRALASYNESLPLLAELPDTRWEPRVLIRRGDILAQMDDHPAARRSWQQGITLLRQQGSPELPAAEERLSAPVTAEPTQFTSGRLLSTFDPAYFIARIASSRRSVRLLNTWTDLATPEHRTAFADAVLAAVDAGAIIQVLLLDPDSPAVAGRAADLLHSVDVPGMIRSNLLVLEALRDRLAPVLRSRLAVRLYTEQPLTTYHRWDTGALVSTFPVGYSSAAATQHEAAVSSTLVQFVEQHFERLWSLEGSTALDDYLRVPLRVSPSDAGHLEVQAEFVRLDGAVYVSSPDLVALLGRGGPDGLLAEVAGDGRHVLAGTGRCRMVPLRDNDGAGAVATAFADKYGAARDSLLRLSSVRR